MQTTAKAIQTTAKAIQTTAKAIQTVWIHINAVRITLIAVWSRASVVQIVLFTVRGRASVVRFPVGVVGSAADHVRSREPRRGAATSRIARPSPLALKRRMEVFAVSVRIVSLRVGLPRHYGEEGARDVFDRPWSSAIAKEPVDRSLWLSREGFEGDGVADRSVHGGPEKAVLAGASEHLSFWRRFLGREDVRAGAFGENLVLAGADENDVCLGDSFALGDAVVQVSQPRQPCWKQARRWRRKDLAWQMQRTGYTGWYFRVLTEGLVAPDDELRLLERPLPGWTVTRANEVMHGRPVDVDAAARLAQVDLLAERWRQSLRRMATGKAGDGKARLEGPNAQ